MGRAGLMSLWRYAHRWGAPPPDFAISMGEGGTPLIRSQRIGPALGLRQLWFKYEGGNPTGSYKDRFASAAVSHLLRDGCRACLGTSSGNTGAALAAYCARAGLACYLAIVEGAPEGKLRQMRAYGARLFRVKDFGCSPEVNNTVMGGLRELAAALGTGYEISAFALSPKGMAGVQTIGYELAEVFRDEAFDVFVPAGGGGLTLAIARGLERLDAATVRQGMSDTDARVRAAAVRISEHLGAAERATLRPERDRLAADTGARVRVQVMLTLGRDDPEKAWPVMLQMLQDGSDEALATAAAAGVGGREIAFLERLFASQDMAENRLRSLLVEQLAFSVMTLREAADVQKLLDLLAHGELPKWAVHAALRGATAVAAGDDPVRLESRPALLDRFQNASEPALAEFATALSARISWPGDGRAEREEVRPLTPAEQKLFDLGREQYALICAACHQPDGMGMTGVAPPLAGSEWVEGDPRIPTEIIIHGLAGPVEVRGQRWDMLMPRAFSMTRRSLALSPTSAGRGATKPRRSPPMT